MDKKEMQALWKQARKEWKKTRRTLKKQWDRLTDEDVYHLDDQLDNLVELLQKRYGNSWEDATEELGQYLADYRSRTQTALNDQWNRMHQRSSSPSWWWALVAVGLVALGIYWQQGNLDLQQLSAQFRKLMGEAQDPRDQNQSQGPTYGAS